MSEIYEVCDAAAAMLRGQAFMSGLQIQRVYLPVTDLKTIAAEDKPTIYLFPAKDGLSLIARDTTQEEIILNIGVIQKLAPTTDATKAASNVAIDPLLKLCRQIALAFKPSFSAGNADWVETTYSPIFDADWMRTDRIFVGVIAPKFQQADSPDVSP